MKTTFLIGTCAMALLCAAGDARAQDGVSTNAARPYRGLFGGGGASDTEQSLSVSASLGAGVGNRLTRPDAQPGQPGEPPVLGSVQSERVEFGTVSGGLQYSLNRERISVGASLATSGRFTPGQEAGYVGGESGSVGVSLALSRRARLSVSHAISYQPYATLFGTPDLGGLGLGVVNAPDLNVGVAPASQVAQSTTVRLTRSIGRHSSFAMNYSGTRVDLASTTNDMSTTTAGVHFTRSLARGLGLRLGYSYIDRHVAGSSSEVPRGHNLDIGLDFNRGLSLTRRTFLTFATGSSMIRSGNQTRYYVTGNAALRREIGRTWNTSLMYSRGINFVERFSDPILSDGISAGFGGQLSRRMQFQSTAGVAFGQFVGRDTGNGQRTYRGGAALTEALTRNMAIGIAYSYYRYRFADVTQLPPGFLSHMNNQSARVYLSVWAPLFQRRARSTDASR